MATALAGLVDTVEQLVGGLVGQQRRWLAAGLAALAGEVEASTLPDPRAIPAVTAGAGAGRVVAVGVVTAALGVLVGRRRDGVPPWVFPGGQVEAGETPAAAAARECAEEPACR